MHSRSLLCLVLLLGACSDPRTDTLQIPSAITGDTYELEVMVPEDYAPSRPYPVVYVLDGYYHFSGLASYVSRERSSGRLDDFILVGIGYAGLDTGNISDIVEIAERRMVDLSWPEDPAGAESGGGDLFHEALVTELLPALEAAYPVIPEARTLMGHSLGGHFVLLDMLTFSPHDSSFSALVSASPAIWWADASLLQDEDLLAQSAEDLPFRLILGTGTLEGIEMNATAEVMVAQLRSRSYPSLKITTEHPVAGHMATAEHIFEAAISELYP